MSEDQKRKDKSSDDFSYVLFDQLSGRGFINVDIKPGSSVEDSTEMALEMCGWPLQLRDEAILGLSCLVYHMISIRKKDGTLDILTSTGIEPFIEPPKLVN